jgi:hypothetical protein
MDGYYVPLKHQSIFSPGSKLWFLCQKSIWNTIRSILCRLLMIAYTIVLNHHIAEIFNENLFYINILFVFLIIIDGFVVLFIRNGLEDSWCSFSILFFVSANVTPLFMLEININTFWENIFQNDFLNHIDSYYDKRLGDSKVLNKITVNNITIDSDKHWLDGFDKEPYNYEISKFETLFCYTLITVRFLLPQVGLTWANIGSMIEFTFNTLFDVNATCSLLREQKFKLPFWLTIFIYCNAKALLICISLNMYTEPTCDNTYERKSKLSPLRNIVENYYFQFLVQIVFAELPFLISRIVIVLNWYELLKADFLYSMVKQSIIITCKILIMVHHKITDFNKKKNMLNLIKFNNMHNFDRDIDS